jgi:hypothetical protein
VDVTINILKEIKSKECILINGLPGIAYIGSLTVDYLIKELGAELVGEVYSRFFPSFVLINKDGVVELLRNEFYYLKNENAPDILLFAGNAQASSPEGQYDIAEIVLDKAISFNVKRVYSIASFLTNKSFDIPRVYGTGTTTALVEEMKRYGIFPMEQGTVSGTNGLIFGLAKRKNIEGICLLGETHGYQTPTGQYLFDVKAVKAVLQVLVDMLRLKIDMKPLDKQNMEMDELIKKMVDVEKRVMEEMRESTERRSSYIT